MKKPSERNEKVYPPKDRVRIVLGRFAVGSAGCWVSFIARSSNGYPYCKINGKQYRVSRLSAWFHLNHDLFDDGLVLHRCDNKACINPAHLYIGDTRENALDRAARQRDSFAVGDRCPWAKIRDADILEIRQRYLAGERASDLAFRYGVTKSAMSNALNGKTHIHVTGGIPARPRYLVIRAIGASRIPVMEFRGFVRAYRFARHLFRTTGRPHEVVPVNFGRGSEETP